MRSASTDRGRKRCGRVRSGLRESCPPGRRTARPGLASVRSDTAITVCAACAARRWVARNCLAMRGENQAGSIAANTSWIVTTWRQGAISGSVLVGEWKTSMRSRKSASGRARCFQAIGGAFNRRTGRPQAARRADRRSYRRRPGTRPRPGLQQARQVDGVVDHAGPFAQQIAAIKPDAQHGRRQRSARGRGSGSADRTR